MATGNSTLARVKFTAYRVSSFICPLGKPEATLWDTEVPGLGLRATKAGSKAYIVKFDLRGKAGRIRIGTPDAWDIQAARTEARRLKVLVDRGEDPREERRQKEEARAKAETQAERGALTLGDVWPAYIDAQRTRWSAHHLIDHERAMQAPGLPRPRSRTLTVAGGLYALCGVRLADLTADTLEAWARAESKTRPTATARNYRLLRAFLGWCAERPEYQGLVDVEAVRARRVRQEIPAPRAKNDVLQREQLRLWFEAMRQIPNPVQSAYLQALLLTGARHRRPA